LFPALVFLPSLYLFLVSCDTIGETVGVRGAVASVWTEDESSSTLFAFLVVIFFNTCRSIVSMIMMNEQLFLDVVIL